MRSIRAVVIVNLLLATASCHSMPERARTVGQVEHVVVCWLKSPGDQSARQRIIEESKAFVGVIPGLVGVKAGPTLPSTRPVVDASFDVAIVMTFESEAALRAYDQHPRHKAAVEHVLRPLVGKLVIYDFQDAPSNPNAAIGNPR